jgi:REP element-mobilizing transposase RayT
LDGDGKMSYERIYEPIGYLITFTTYGTWLHGNQAGSIRKNNKISSTELLDANPKLEKVEIAALQNAPFIMNSQKRRIVLEAILEVCRYRNWTAFAIHVRANHVHAVVYGRNPVERIMNDFKAYATKALKKAAIEPLPKKLWTRHGSTRYLWNEQELSDAVHYVRDQQGKMMTFGQSITEGIDHPSPDREGGD